MATLDPAPIPYPLSTFPGMNPQEAAGRLINTYAELIDDPKNPTGPAKWIYRRAPGLTQHAATGQVGYRGGLIVKNLSYETWANDAKTVDVNGALIDLGNLPGTKKVSIARNNAANPDVVAVDIDNGAFILNTTAVANASIVATIAGAVFTAGDSVSLLFVNSSVPGFPVLVIYTLGGGETATTVATGLKNLINANATLAAASVSAISALGVLTVSQAGAIGNSTQLLPAITGTGSETVTLNPVAGLMTGGAGTPGIIFAGVPLAYNGGGALPQPNSVCFQDGYMFFTIADGRCFATAINSLSMNGLTFIFVLGRQDVTLLRGITFSGVLLLFTTGSCEIFQDAAIPAPAFPYSRSLVIDFGLIQPNAIAGWETGFAELLWVAQDFGVYWLTTQSTAPIKVSTPDLERLIEAQVRAGNTLEAGCYIHAGKKFWTLSSPAWSWEFNIKKPQGGQWNERQSLLGGVYGRWRFTGGHPAFNKWLGGDTQSGNLLWIDSTNFTEHGQPQLWRIESGPVKNFPGQIRVARADFDFDMGTGIAVSNFQMIVAGAAASPTGAIRLTVNDTAQAKTNDQANVSAVGGTVEANGSWPITVVDATHIDLQGSVFVHAYTSGGVAIDVTSTPNAVNPVCAISCSLDGINWDVPSIRSLGLQAKAKRFRASVKNRGQSGPMGNRWRIDITDPVPVGFFGGTQSSNMREVGE
jgi:hypothetical protein